MNDSTRDGLIEEIAHETAHFASAPAAFFDAWKSGVALAGTHLFGRGTRADLEHATSVLATLVSFYNADDGGRLLERIGVRGLGDLGGLDLKRRAVIAALLLTTPAGSDRAARYQLFFASVE